MAEMKVFDPAATGVMEGQAVEMGYCGKTDDGAWLTAGKRDGTQMMLVVTRTAEELKAYVEKSEFPNIKFTAIPLFRLSPDATPMSSYDEAGKYGPN